MGDDTGLDSLVSMVDADEMVVYPTSTLPALGCRPTTSALDLLFEIKQRPAGMPVSLAVLDLEQADDLVVVSDAARDLLSSFPLGSITLLLPARTRLDPRLGGDLIAIRPLAHGSARRLIAATGPLTATSANMSGSVALNDCLAAARSLGLPDDAAMPESCRGGPPSTLVTLHPEAIVIREGVISAHQVARWSRTRS